MLNSCPLSFCPFVSMEKGRGLGHSTGTFQRTPGHLSFLPLRIPGALEAACLHPIDLIIRILMFRLKFHTRKIKIVNLITRCLLLLSSLITKIVESLPIIT